VDRREQKPLRPQSQFLPWDDDDFLFTHIHKILHIPALVIDKTFNTFCNQINPILLHRLLNDQNFLTHATNKYKDIVDSNIRNCFVVANKLVWADDVTSKYSQKSIFLTQNNEPVVIDSGASCCLTNCKSDFIGPITKSSVSSLQTVNSSIKVQGEGIVEWVAKDINGNRIKIQINDL
jgi:hypothetical protein